MYCTSPDPKYPAGIAGTLAFGKSQAQVGGQVQVRHLPQSWGIVDRIWSIFFCWAFWLQVRSDLQSTTQLAGAIEA